MGKGPAEKRGPRKSPAQVGYVMVVPGGKGRARMEWKSPAWWEKFTQAGGGVK